jgi:Uncharacterized protein conserved in bacteria (DUF2330)
MRRLGIALGTTVVALILTTGSTLACGGLIGPNGAVNLVRTTTFAGYHNGVEHYVTAFKFAGGGGKFGSITPLPDIPSSVVKGGDWTLQRLIRETQPVLFDAALRAAAPAAAGAEELMKVRIDALDLTVLRGGAADIGAWAKAHGFRLPPDAPEVLDFYASRSQIFLAGAFDADAARDRGQQIGDGTPVHITIPTAHPWVPLRILALGKGSAEQVQADVYLLTDRRPSLLPAPNGRNGLALAHSAAATDSLLTDLRSDRGMDWVPSNGWLTQIGIDAQAKQLSFDLAVDETGSGHASRLAAGLELASPTKPGSTGSTVDAGRLGLALIVVLTGLGAVFGVMAARRPDQPAPPAPAG